MSYQTPRKSLRSNRNGLHVLSPTEGLDINCTRVMCEPVPPFTLQPEFNGDEVVLGFVAGSAEAPLCPGIISDGVFDGDALGMPSGGQWLQPPTPILGGGFVVNGLAMLGVCEESPASVYLTFPDETLPTLYDGGTATLYSVDGTQLAVAALNYPPVPPAVAHSLVGTFTPAVSHFTPGQTYFVTITPP